MAVTSETGVARPRAQGQAMMRTATEFEERVKEAGLGAEEDQAAKVAAARPATAGTKKAETRSARRAMGGLAVAPPRRGG